MPDVKLYCRDTVNTTNSPPSQVQKLKQFSLVFASLFILVSSFTFGQPDSTKSSFQNKSIDQSIVALLADDFDEIADTDPFFVYQPNFANAIVSSFENFIGQTLQTTTDARLSQTPFYLKIRNLRI